MQLNKKGRYLISATISLLVLGLGYHIFGQTWDSLTLNRLEKQWIGFDDKEKGFYNFTVVTALFDIGRGKWWKQDRSYEKYLGFLLELLKMDVNIVIFIEPKGVNFVKRIRRNREKRTRIVPMNISDLQYFSMLPRMTEIMESKEFQENNSNYLSGLAEGTYPLYNLIVNSKLGFVHQAIQQNIFKSEYFVWLDSGYGHGDSSIYPPDGIWNPRHLFQYPDKVTFAAFENLTKMSLDGAKNLHKIETAWMAGGLLAGSLTAMDKFYFLHKSVLIENLERGRIDDDQTINVDCFLNDPGNFNPVLGGWYDLMKPFR